MQVIILPQAILSLRAEKNKSLSHAVQNAVSYIWVVLCLRNMSLQAFFKSKVVF